MAKQSNNSIFVKAAKAYDKANPFLARDALNLAQVRQALQGVSFNKAPESWLRVDPETLALGHLRNILIWAIQDIAQFETARLKALAALDRIEAAGGVGEQITAAQVLNWLRARPGSSWVATIVNVKQAVAELAASPSPKDGGAG